MTGKILYCEKCGKLIPPEEAEAEDFAELEGVGPMCPLCLEKTDPALKQRFDSVRSTRIRMIRELKSAKPPQQVYPAPGSSDPDEYQTTPEIVALRAELASDFTDSGAAKPAAPAAPKPAPPTPEAPPPAYDERTVGEALGKTGLADPLRLPRTTRRALWALLGAAGLAIVVMLALPRGSAPETPAPPSDSGETPEPAPDPAAQVLPPQPQVPAPPGVASESDELLKEVETIVTLTGESPSLGSAGRALEKLRLVAARGDKRATAAADEALARYEAYVDARVRQGIRQCAERAEDLAAQERFQEAARQLALAEESLSEVSPWARERGKVLLAGLRADLEARKTRALAERVAAIDAMLKEGREEQARAAAEALRRHAERAFQAAAEDALQRLAQAEADRLAAERRAEELARRAWRTFFQEWDKAMKEGDWAHAEALCDPPAEAPLRKGGMEDGAEVLKGFAGEARAARQLFEDALAQAAKKTGRVVNLAMKTGRAQGELAGTEARSLVVRLGGAAELKVPVDRLAADGLAELLEARRGEGRAKYGPALATLQFVNAEDAARADAELLEFHRGLQMPLPLHWSRRFGREFRDQQREALARKFEALKTARAAGDPEAVRLALTEVQAILDTQPELRLTPEERELLEKAGLKTERRESKHVVFQDGVLPGPDYVGLRVDQINRYYRNAQRTDVDTQTGLKVGSYNDTQRILFRFEGLQETLKDAKVKRATLELYQTEGARAKDAVVALYALKKAWTPDAGTWVNADEKRKSAWQRPGASGPDDAETKPAAELRFDQGTGLWREWDLTEYVQALLADKIPNHGLLMRVAADEPNYHIRFYPDTDLAEGRDPKLRPRLVVEIEKPAEEE
ncbi:MAG: DNRLRE domain-containing protein [Planctomycetota bacterium]|nr:DNRLRE domain-containing protein [Planctomycetota bacterium]